MMTTETEARLIVKAAYAAADYEAVRSSKGNKAAVANFKGRLEGLAEAAAILGLVQAPFGFFLAALEAVREVGPPPAGRAVSRETSERDRVAWMDAAHAAIVTRISQ